MDIIIGARHSAYPIGVPRQMLTIAVCSSSSYSSRLKICVFRGAYNKV